MGGVILHTAMAFIGCSIVGSLVEASAQIASTEVMAKIVIAIAAISNSIRIGPTIAVIVAIVVVVSAVIVPTAVVILATIMAIIVARATLVEWL